MRLIDADRYKEELESLIEICDFEGENDVKEGIQSAIHTLDSENFTPTVDAEPVVRCKDCKYMFTQGKTTKFYFCNEFEISVDETDYCAWGEKMDEVEE